MVTAEVYAMAKRETYRNGDPIWATRNGCDGCRPCFISGEMRHESGCPDMWRDHQVECAWCGQMFYPTEAGQLCCDESCSESYYT